MTRDMHYSHYLWALLQANARAHLGCGCVVCTRAMRDDPHIYDRGTLPCWTEDNPDDAP